MNGVPLDLSGFTSRIGKPRQEVDEWFEPIMASGRSAVFIDTGFLRALLDDSDQFADQAKVQFEEAERTNFYTTSLVFAELVRQIAKDRGYNAFQRRQFFSECTALLVEPGVIHVCAPPRELINAAYMTLLEMRESFIDLDLCDVVSLQVLHYAEHNRVFGFDRTHFTAYGALLEP